MKQWFVDSCGKGRVHVCCWEPKTKPIAIVQIVHGIAEYASRYNDFAEFLTNNGFLVVAEDHMGHGESIASPHEQGCFSGGWFCAVDDTYRLLLDTKKEYSDLPYILFGHSMGSFMVRTILEKYPECPISGCIICGTGWMPELVLNAGIALSKAVCRISGENKPSKIVQKMAFGGYNKRIEHAKSHYDWLSRDAQIVKDYELDPLCGFIPSAGLMRDMLTGILYIQQLSNLQRMRKDLPILLIAGGDDPVGDYGEGVKKTADSFINVGMQKVQQRIYPLCRHEILNEINRDEIYLDVYNWIIRHIK